MSTCVACHQVHDGPGLQCADCQAGGHCPPNAEKRGQTAAALQLSEAEIRVAIKSWYRLQGAIVIDTEQQRANPRVDAGLSDLVVAWPGRGIRFIECKDAKGKQRPAQRDFEVAVVAAGGRYWLVRSLEEVIQLEKGV
jgi:hypothetical protein